MFLFIYLSLRAKRWFSGQGIVDERHGVISEFKLNGDLHSYKVQQVQVKPIKAMDEAHILG